jgi:hypothetical protein
MTTDATTQPRRRRNGRILLLLAASLFALSLAGVTAHQALAASSSRYITPARSVELLRNAFGPFSERPLRETQVVVAPTSAATWALSDDVNIANGVWNPRAGRPWARSDARTMWPSGMGGFTDPATGTVYINAQNAVESATPHELLHANASPDFLQAVGVALNEGITEQLALDALAVSGVRAEKVPAYPKERTLADAIIKMTGRDRLLRAYFNGGPSLADFVGAVGADTLTSVKQSAASGDVGTALSALTAATLAGQSQ